MREGTTGVLEAMTDEPANPEWEAVVNVAPAALIDIRAPFAHLRFLFALERCLVRRRPVAAKYVHVKVPTCYLLLFLSTDFIVRMLYNFSNSSILNIYAWSHSYVLNSVLLCLDWWVVGWVVFHHFQVLLHHFHVLFILIFLY